MKIVVVDNKTTWDALVIKDQASFVQSWEWGEILKKEGKRVERVVVQEQEQIVGFAHIVCYKAFFWHYAFCPKGPIENVKFKDQKSNFYEVIGNYLKNKNCLFFRIEPQEKEFEHKILKAKKTVDINPRATTILDLRKTDEELLGSMHQKTRYNIRLAEKKDLVVRNEKNLQTFMKLMKETGERDKFRLHEEKHYEYILCSPLSYQLTVEYRGEPIAVGVFIGFGNTFTYLYGASHYAFRNVMAPYLIQWEGIKLGKQLGYTHYDFFGIAPKLNQKSKIKNQNETDGYVYDLKHQYAGVTRFKLGFGGVVSEEIGTWDVILNSWQYRMYQVLRTMRRLI